jgi:hypothetical protein
MWNPLDPLAPCGAETTNPYPRISRRCISMMQRALRTQYDSISIFSHPRPDGNRAVVRKKGQNTLAIRVCHHCSLHGLLLTVWHLRGNTKHEQRRRLGHLLPAISILSRLVCNSFYATTGNSAIMEVIRRLLGPTRLSLPTYYLQGSNFPVQLPSQLLYRKVYLITQ